MPQERVAPSASGYRVSQLFEMPLSLRVAIRQSRDYVSGSRTSTLTASLPFSLQPAGHSARLCVGSGAPTGNNTFVTVTRDLHCWKQVCSGVRSVTGPLFPENRTEVAAITRCQSRAEAGIGDWAAVLARFLPALCYCFFPHPLTILPDTPKNSNSYEGPRGRTLNETRRYRYLILFPLSVVGRFGTDLSDCLDADARHRIWHTMLATSTVLLRLWAAWRPAVMCLDATSIAAPHG